jgi:hypothetical protein
MRPACLLTVGLAAPPAAGAAERHVAPGDSYSAGTDSHHPSRDGHSGGYAPLVLA